MRRNLQELGFGQTQHSSAGKLQEKKAQLRALPTIGVEQPGENRLEIRDGKGFGLP